jgi:hypothetical protein
VAVADQLAVRADAAKLLEDGELVLDVAVEEHLAAPEGHPPLDQRPVELERYRRAQRPAYAIPVEHRPVLGHDHVEPVREVGEDPP